jgi:hypothetical protein
MVGLQISGEADLQRLDSEMEKLSADERSTVGGIKRAASLAEIAVVDS